MPPETPNTIPDADFTPDEQQRLLQSMFDDSEIGNSQEQIPLLGCLLSEWRIGDLRSLQRTATEFQLDKETARRRNDPTFKISPDLREACLDSAKKLLRKLPATLKRFYSGPSGAAAAWTVTIEHRVTSGGRRAWALSVTRRPKVPSASDSLPHTDKDNPIPPSGKSTRSVPVVKTLVDVPVLVHFIERPEILEPLKQQLLSDGDSVSVVAVEGMGGVGKSLMAARLCRDPEVRSTFTHGIIWLKIGSESRTPFEEHVRTVIRALGQEGSDYSSATYRALLEDRAVLIVLDDVWMLADLEPFLLSSGRSRLLYTSRDQTLAGPVGAKSVEIGTLDDVQSRDCLDRWSGREGNLPERYAADIVHECGGLALGLSMIGAALEGKPDEDWRDILKDLRNAKLKNIDVRPANYPHETLHAAIEVSVNALVRVNYDLKDGKDLKDLYLRLSVLLDDMPAATPVLQSLWGVDEDEARRIARLLASRSLARREQGGLVLHDLQLKYIRSEHPSPDLLALQHAGLRRSFHIVSGDPRQFTAQMTGRLLAHASRIGICSFLDELNSNSPKPRLRPLSPSLDHASSPIERPVDVKGWVLSVALTPDGKRAVAGLHDGRVIVLDLENDYAHRVLEGHTSWVNSVALTPDGRRAISGSVDKTVIVWDLEDNSKSPRVLVGHTANVTSVALTADGKRAISGSADKAVIVWDLEGNQPPRVLAGHTNWVAAVAITEDGNRGVSVSGNANPYGEDVLIVWDLVNYQPSRYLGEDHSNYHAVAITTKGEFAVSASSYRPDQTDSLTVWDLKGHEPPRRVSSDGIMAIAITPDGKTAMSGSRDGTVTLWDLDDKQTPWRLPWHKEPVNDVSLSSNGKRAISTSRDGQVVWKLDDRNRVPILPDHQGVVSLAAVAPDGSRAISVSSSLAPKPSEFTIWSIDGLHIKQTGQLEKDHNRPRFVESVIAGPVGIISIWSNRTLIVCDWEGKEKLRHSFPILEGSWNLTSSLSPDGRQVAFGEMDGNIVLWDWESDLTRRFRGADTNIWTLAVSSECVLYCAPFSKAIMVWNAATDQQPRILEGHRAHVTAMVLTPDGQHAVSGAGDGQLILWDLEGNRPPHVLADLEDAVCAVALTPDGRRLMCGSYKTLTVWDVLQKRLLVSFECDRRIASCAAAAGKIIFGDDSGHVHFLALEE